MGISVSSTLNSANTKHSMSLSSRGPDWSLIPSAGKSNKSKAEFADEIKELARRAAETTSKKELEYIHSQRARLCAEYISDVSPDRRALYRQAENSLKRQNGNPKCHGSGELTLLDFLEAAEGKTENLAEKKFALAGGGTLTYSAGVGWHEKESKAETQVHGALKAAYYDAYHAARQEINGMEVQGGFDARA